MGLAAGALIAVSHHRVVTDILFAEDRMLALAADMGVRVGDNQALLEAYRNGFSL